MLVILSPSGGRCWVLSSAFLELLLIKCTCAKLIRSLLTSSHGDTWLPADLAATSLFIIKVQERDLGVYVLYDISCYVFVDYKGVMICIPFLTSTPLVYRA